MRLLLNFLLFFIIALIVSTDCSKAGELITKVLYEGQSQIYLDTMQGYIKGDSYKDNTFFESEDALGIGLEYSTPLSSIQAFNVDTKSFLNKVDLNLGIEYYVDRPLPKQKYSIKLDDSKKSWSGVLNQNDAWYQPTYIYIGANYNIASFYIGSQLRLGFVSTSGQDWVEVSDPKFSDVWGYGLSLGFKHKDIYTFDFGYIKNYFNISELIDLDGNGRAAAAQQELIRLSLGYRFPLEKTISSEKKPEVKQAKKQEKEKDKAKKPDLLETSDMEKVAEVKNEKKETPTTNETAETLNITLLPKKVSAGNTIFFEVQTPGEAIAVSAVFNDASKVSLENIKDNLWEGSKTIAPTANSGIETIKFFIKTKDEKLILEKRIFTISE